MVMAEGRIIRALVPTGVVLVLACGGGGAGVGPGPDGGGGKADAGADAAGDGAPIDPGLASFCQDVRGAMIKFLGKCSGLVPEIATWFVTSEPCASWGPAVTGGRLSFDPTETAACIADLTAASCDADALPRACDRVLTGRRKPGETCNQAAQIAGFSECETGSFCVSAFGAAGCQGTCVLGRLLTQSCGPEQPCTSGETCSLGSFQCASKGTMGSPCGLDSIVACTEGLYCSNLSGGTCSPRLAVGAACSGESSQCAPPATCDRGLALTGTCKVPPKPGDSCTPMAYECGIGFSYCGADSKCHALAGIGQPCVNTDGEGTYCVLGTCDMTLATPVCRPYAVGEECASTAECVPGSLCLPHLGSPPLCSALCI